VLLGDVDGDGCADLVYVDDRRVLLWINQSGNGWSRPLEIPATPRVTTPEAVQLVDLLGSGIRGLLWSADANGLGRDQAFFLDFTGVAKPYLLDEMDNHMGAVTRVQYAPSTRFYLEDAARRGGRWQTPLPFPVQVVARVEAIDEISRGKLTTEYTYHHGYWDGDEREFRGFGRVDQRDTESFERSHAPGPHPHAAAAAVPGERFSPPVATRTWYHQGPVVFESRGWRESDFAAEFWDGDSTVLGRPPAMVAFLDNLPPAAHRDALRALRGRVLRTELYALDGSARMDRPYTVTEHLYGAREEEPPGPQDDGRLGIFFPHALAQRTTRWERGDDPMTQFLFTGDYDACGQPRRQTDIACPRGWRSLTDTPASPYLATRTVTAYAATVDPQIHIKDRVATVTTYEIRSDGGQQLADLAGLADDDAALAPIGHTVNYYDGEAFAGWRWGRSAVTVPWCGPRRWC
jgi:hypothetical protein